jgi:Tfp pilus assembly protein PilZ
MFMHRAFKRGLLILKLDMEFQVGDEVLLRVFLRVSPTKYVIRFNINLNQRES